MQAQHSPTDLAYLAGIVDADGYVGILRTVKQSSANGATVYHSLRVGITGSRTEPHELAQSLFGGNTQRYEREVHKDQNQWSRDGTGAAQVLFALVPFLRVKRDRAELGLRFQAMLDGQKGSHLGFSPRLTEEHIADRDRYWVRMVQLNGSEQRLNGRNRDFYRSTLGVSYLRSWT